MKDNGTMEVKHCGTCRNLGKSEVCINCRNGNPPADAAAYDLLWEAKAEEREFEPGEVVLWEESECTVLSVCESDGAKMLEILKIDVDTGNSGEFVMSRHLIPAVHCAKRVKELTAKEYAEKLREYFGWNDDIPLTHKPCFHKECETCVFNRPGITCNATIYTVDPEMAMQMIQEQETQLRAKRKTYREDFFEKFPNADRTATGSPMPCRNKLYFMAAPCSETKPCHNCADCWNEVMPEEGR